MADKVLEPEPTNLSGEWKRNAGAAAPDETKFLRGPAPRRFEFWQAVKIFRELVYGFRKLHFVGPCVTVFGSARSTAPPLLHVAARPADFWRSRVHHHDRRAGASAGGQSRRGRRQPVDWVQHRPADGKPNPFVDSWIDFEYFFVRKLMLVKYSYAFIVCPAGSALDELFEVATLIRPGRVDGFPSRHGTDWRPLLDQLRWW